jgi:hypothetical protein
MEHTMKQFKPGDVVKFGYINEVEDKLGVVIAKSPAGYVVWRGRTQRSGFDLETFERLEDGPQQLILHTVRDVRDATEAVPSWIRPEIEKRAQQEKEPPEVELDGKRYEILIRIKNGEQEGMAKRT